MSRNGLISKREQARRSYSGGTVTEPGGRDVRTCLCVVSERVLRMPIQTILFKMKYLEASCVYLGCCQVTAKDRLIIYSSYFRLEADNMCLSPTQYFLMKIKNKSIKMSVFIFLFMLLREWWHFSSTFIWFFFDFSLMPLYSCYYGHQWGLSEAAVVTPSLLASETSGFKIHIYLLYWEI